MMPGVARVLQQLISPPGQCSYLADRQSVSETRVMLDVTPAEMDNLLVHGWRRFGPTYFRPRCATCQECVSLRIPVETFEPSKSQRRAWKKSRGIRVEVGVPKVDGARMELYHAWHAQREDARGWNIDTLDEEQYAMQFCFPHPCARELAYFQEDRLVAVGIVDETPTALSSVYFYFHPDVARLSLGTASVMFELDLARDRGRQHLYMGYRVKDCASLLYKGTFGPHQLLLGRPDLNTVPQWVSPGDHPDAPATR
jgi:arginine-tRNA-protein transferase